MFLRQLSIAVGFALAANTACAQQYKPLAEQDRIIREKTKLELAVSDAKGNPLPEGYYVTPYSREDSKFYFHISGNGEINDSVKIFEGDFHSSFNTRNGMAIGTIKVYQQGKLSAVVETNDSGRVLSETEYDAGLIQSVTVYDSSGHTAMIKNYKSGQKVREATYAGGVPLIKVFSPRGYLISIEDESAKTYTLFYPNGKVQQKASNDKTDTWRTTKEYDTAGRLTAEEKRSLATTFQFNDTVSIRTTYYANGKKKTQVTATVVKETIQTYNQNGKLLKKEIKELPPSPMIGN